MKKTIISILSLTTLVSGCASWERSTFLGVGIGGAIGGGIGTATSEDAGGALLGLGIGAVLGGAIGLLAFQDKEQKEPLVKNPVKKGEESKIPSLTSPEVRRIWVPEKIDSNKFIDGHYEFIIEKNSVWTR